MSKSLNFRGLAATFARYRKSGLNVRYAPYAFDRFVNRADSGYTLIRVDHLNGLWVPKVGPIRWDVTDAGLEVEFAINTDDEVGQGAALAIIHGHLTGLSIAARFTSENVQGNSVTVYGADVEELSLTATPANPACFVAPAGGARSTAKTLPENFEKRRCLIDFLDAVGIDHSPIPQAVSSRTRIANILPPARSAAIAPRAKLELEPVVLLDSIRKAAPSHPPKGAKAPKKTGDFVQDLHAEWIFKHRHTEWQRLQDLIARSPTKQVEIIY